MIIVILVLLAISVLMASFSATVNFKEEKPVLATVALTIAILNISLLGVHSFRYGKKSHEVLKRLDDGKSYGVNFTSSLPTGEIVVFLDDLNGEGGEAWDRIAILKPYPPKDYIQVELNGKTLLIPVPQKMADTGLH